MSHHQEINIYDTILKEERKDRLYFWSVSAIILVSSLIVISTSIWG